MFNYFIALARRWGEKILNKEKVPLHARLLYRLGDLLVYGPLKNRLGVSCVRLAYTAGEAIGPEIFRFWRALGVNLKQLYGQTEASVYITAQPDGEIYADTVGKPNIDVDIKIAENGELFVARRVRRLQGSAEDGGDEESGRLGAHRGRRIDRSRYRPSQDHRPRQGRRKAQ
jgi:long-subunit acyl-CoA synthetase (AMP-forming)